MSSHPTPPTRERYGPYIVKDKIGAGGMATVYRARHLNGSNDIALKVLAIHLSGHEDVRRRFEREARTLIQFNHPHILPVFDFGEDHDTPYIAMKLLSGHSLHKLLHGEPLPEPLVGQITRQIASALDYAHARGIVHRDVKPANILLDHDHTPFLGDFGVAYLTEGDPDARLTRMGTFVGTPAYASPEQCRGEQVGRASDIYSLAILVFEMTTGRQPFEAASPLALIKQHLHEPPPNPLAFNLALPIMLYHVLVRALAKLPEHRYPSAMKFSEAVDEALGLHALPDQRGNADDWLYGDLTPVTIEEQPVMPHTPATGPGPASPSAGAPPAIPPFSVAMTYGEGDPFSEVGIENIAAGFDSDEFAADFDDSFNPDVDDTGADFMDIHPPPPTNDTYPSDTMILGQLTQTAPPAAAPSARPWLAYGVILASLAVIVAGILVGYGRLTNRTKESTVATYQSPAFSMTFDYPADWIVIQSDLALLSETPTGTLIISDQPILPGSDYGAATITIAIQRIDPTTIYDVPSTCKSQIIAGPDSTFDCMAAQDYIVPVFEPFQTLYWTHGTRLPGTLPPTRVSLPVILLPTGEPTWVAIIIVQWAGHADARGILDDIAQSLR